jgi:hypothetical protein
VDLIVVDNFLSDNIFNLLKEEVESNKQSWFFLSTTTGYETIYKEHYAFSCDIVRYKNSEIYNPFIHCSKYVKLLNEQVKSTYNFSTVIRSRLDMTTYRGKQITFPPHIDIAPKHYTSIFYLIECDAPTIIYNQKHFTEDPIDSTFLTIMNTITPKQNRLVVFDGNHIHTGTSATDVSRRILINTNYI